MPKFKPNAGFKMESPLKSKYSASGKGTNNVDKSKQSKVKPGTSKSATNWKGALGTGLQHLGDVITNATKVR